MSSVDGKNDKESEDDGSSSDSSPDGPEVRKKEQDIAKRKALAEKRAATAEKKKVAAERKAAAAEKKKAAAEKKGAAAAKKAEKAAETAAKKEATAAKKAAAKEAKTTPKKRLPIKKGNATNPWKQAPAKKSQITKKAPPKKKPRKFEWKNSAAKKHLRQLFKDRIIPFEYSTEQGGPGPKSIFDEHCKMHAAFKGMEYDNLFPTRLRLVRDDIQSKEERKELDRAAFTNFRKIHPKKAFNSLGQPRWEGSEAECSLKSDIETILKLEDEGEIKKKLEPKVLYNDEDRPEYRVFTLNVFRDHIYQERRLRKFEHYQELEKAKKKEKESKNVEDP